MSGGFRATILKGLAAQRSSELRHFVPKPDFYPLMTVFGAAVGTVVYCSYRAIAFNPDVHLSKEHKHDELHESGITLKRAQDYYESLFRKAWRSRAQAGPDDVDTHIHF